jgi:TorA maturation chaperone TorD
MENFLKETQAEAPDRLSEKLGVDRTRLYRGLSPNYGPPPPYEMVWSKTWQDVRLLSVLAATYRENDLQPSEDVHERQDYLGVELDFIHILAEREAAAWEAGSTGRAQSLLETQKTFFKEHLQPWVNFFIKSAFEYVKTDFYQGHLLMMRGFMDDLGKEFAEAPAAPKS